MDIFRTNELRVSGGFQSSRKLFREFLTLCCPPSLARVVVNLSFRRERSTRIKGISGIGYRPICPGNLFSKKESRIMEKSGSVDGEDLV